MVYPKVTSNYKPTVSDLIWLHESSHLPLEISLEIYIYIFINHYYINPLEILKAHENTISIPTVQTQSGSPKRSLWSKDSGARLGEMKRPAFFLGAGS